MAYNSDGYIMIDFTEVDFRRTNQTIDGLYKRCVDVIGTNKFILVINANGRTPLPATCSFTNNQYVIDTCVYMFAISSNDNLFIRRNDVPASDIIDDSSVSVDKTWSSNKIDTELDGKADTSALADYQPKLIAGTNITIDENNVISSTGGAVIDDTVIVNNKVWSSLNTVKMLAPIDTVVGSPATFKTSLAFPLVACTTSITATQEGTGNPSPSNVRNIIGVDDITLTVNGVDTVIDLDGTCYGASIDLLSGVMSVNTGYKVLNGSEANWVFRATSNSFYLTINDMKRLSYSTEGKCNKFATVRNLNDYGVAFGASNTAIYFNGMIDNIPEVTDLQTWKTWLSNNNVQVIYPLAEPLNIQLTPTQIINIVGSNTIASDTGSLTVSYKALPIDLL